MAGVYLSYPFCAQKCTYCNFASGVLPRHVEAQYPDALIRELASTNWEWAPDTVYLGGGTPSALDPDVLDRILAAVPGSPWREATIEAAPGSFTPEAAGRWVRAGINRVSLGVQSFIRNELARTGRKHTTETVVADVANLRAAGIGNFNLDLISGLPGQTAGSWAESLDWIERISPPHVSVYMLEVDEDSRLGQEVLLNGKRYGAPTVPDDELIAELYQSAASSLKGLGIERYEISNFARPGFESLHNLKYWRLEPYFGFGVDAHSFDGRLRWQSADCPGEYVAGSARTESEPANRMEEKFFVGLRLSEGIHPNAQEWLHWDRPIQRFISEGLLERTEDRLRLTNQGILFSNEVFAEFV